MMALLAKFCGHEFRLDPADHSVQWREEDGFERRGRLDFPAPLSRDANLVVSRDELIITDGFGRVDWVARYVGEPLTFEFRQEPHGYSNNVY